MTTAVVLGGGFGGVLAAAALARHVHDVTLVESGRYPAGPDARPGLPQGHHSHLLVTGGAQALDTLLPGTLEALRAAGAHRRGLPDDALILTSEGWFRRHDTGAYLISCTRWLMDHVVRRRALGGGAVRVRERTHALGLIGTPARVTGVVVRCADGATEAIRADLVVDATGRRSRAVRWLAGIGARGIETATFDPGLVYSTRIYQAPSGLATAVPAVMLHPAPAVGERRPGRGATLFPIEGDRWIVTLTGERGAEPPTDEPGFTECAYALRSPVVTELMAAAKPIGGVRPYRGTANRRRYFERGPRPDGFLVLGDALAAVNPVHSHGMSVAALGVLRLSDALHRHGPAPSVLADVQVAVAADADRSWRLATATARNRPTMPGRAESAVRGRMAQALLGDPELMTWYFRTQTLVLAPTVGTLRLGEMPPLLSADEAIAQYPALGEWWNSGHVGKRP